MKTAKWLESQIKVTSINYEGEDLRHEDLCTYANLVFRGKKYTVNEITSLRSDGATLSIFEISKDGWSCYYDRDCDGCGCWQTGNNEYSEYRNITVAIIAMLEDAWRKARRR